MSFGVIHTNLSSYNVAISSVANTNSNTNRGDNNSSYQVGKIYGVVTTENTPTKKAFDSVGGYSGIGTIFFKYYDQSKDDIIDIEGIDTLPKAIPLYPQNQYIPLINELVYLIDLPSDVTQINSNSIQKYYITINLWNNPQQNAQPSYNSSFLGTTFLENSNIRPLIPYQGDYIIGGRQGSALRFSTTSRPATTPNEWSNTGNEDDPITILTNGLKFERNKQFYVERINKDDSSLYLTSTQTIPLDTDKNGVLNNLTNPKNVSDYINSQAILNANKVILNSKKDEVMIFAETNVEINTKNVINLNADTRVHLNTDSVFLGRYDPNALPQPLLLGKETITLFTHLIKTLNKLASTFSKTISTPQGSPIINLNTAGTELFADLLKAADLLKKTPSTRIFLAPDNAIQTNNQTPATTNEEFQVIQASYRPPAEETEILPTTNEELVEVEICPINFQSTFASGNPDFKNDPNTITLLEQKVQELITCIKQTQNKANVKSIRISIQGGESRVPNPEEFSVRGSLANARRDNLINYLQNILKRSLNIVPEISPLPSVLGNTLWIINEKDPNYIANVTDNRNDQRFTIEQFVTVKVIAKQTQTRKPDPEEDKIIPPICNFTIDAKSGLVGSKNNNFITYDNTFDVKDIPNGNKIKITFASYFVPDLMIIKAGNKVYNTGWIGEYTDYSSLLATVLGNAYNGRPPLPFPQDIELWTVEEAIKQWGTYNKDQLKDEMSHVLTNVNWNKNTINQIEQITWYNFKTNPIKQKLIPREGDQIKIISRSGNDITGNYGDTITIIKDSSFESIDIKIYSPLGTTIWDIVGRCE